MPVPPRPRREQRAVHGVLLLDKPLGLSSNDALQHAKRLFSAEKAGHTGTLDPLATGLLPLCFGAATKFAQVSLDADKRYTATLQLGVTTTTGDAEGEIVDRRPVDVDRARIEAVCRSLLGPISQLPPMHSALKHAGKPLYAYARDGMEVERQPRDVMLHAIDVLHDNGSGDVWTIDVHCSKGTYIRTLAEHIGAALGCGAHLVGLRRTGSGGLRLAAAVTLADLDAMDPAERDAVLLPADALVADWPAIRLQAEDAGRFLSGVRRRLPLADAPQVRVYGPEPGAFLGSGHITAGELIADRLLSPLEVQGLLTSARPPVTAPSHPHLNPAPIASEVSNVVRQPA